MADDCGSSSQQSSSTGVSDKIDEDLALYNQKVEANNDEDSGITMVDVLEKEEELDEDANAVLGGSDDQNCTYPSGYIKRQALYACGTCVENNGGDIKSSGGICLACSYSCHEGHRLFELYTKRNFRCDCGNSKFSINPCKLFPDKEPVNKENNYNQNFDGVYCTCSRPYPDPEDEIEDEMIQCIICEDWYHGRHLGTPVPVNNEYGEMICGNCMDKCEFLMAYNPEFKNNVIEPDEGIVTPDENVDVESEDKGLNFITHCTNNSTTDPAKASTSSSSCVWRELLSSQEKQKKRVKGTAVFWPDGWRSKLCTCPNCQEKYEELNMGFLLHDDDTVHHYEEQGKAKNSPQSRYDQGMQALSKLDRIRQVEAIHGYNDMKSELLDYLKNFAGKKVVRKEDIDDFFSQMRAKKRRRVDIPHFCR